MRHASSLVLASLLAGTGVTSAAHAADSNSPSPIELARKLNQAFIDVADRVSAAVVVITVTQKIDLGNDAGGDESPMWEWLPREFRRKLQERFRQDGHPLVHPPVQGQGSGVVVREDGYILTNRHVVERAEKIRVRFKDGSEFDAEIRGTDPQSDLAVIKIKGSGLPAVTYADSARVRVGEFAIAVGAPFDLDYTVTVGHVSAKGRSRVVPDPSMDQDFVQTDASINPGNSGGPLVNIEGELIGINTLIRGMNTGIGFAIPSNLAREVADKLIANGHYLRAWIGIEIRALKEDNAVRDLLKGVDTGIVVRGIRQEGPAARSDLRPGDVITAVDGHPVADAIQFRQAIRSKDIGSTVTLDTIRGGKPIKIKVKTEAWPEPAQPVAEHRPATEAAESPALGFAVKVLTQDLAKEFEVEVTPGLIVTEVAEDGLAAQTGLQPGDVITAVNQQNVTTLKEFRRAVKNADPKKGVLLNLVREGVSRLEVLKEAGE